MSYYIDVKKYKKGNVIFKQGDKGDKFYVIIKGKIDILILNEGTIIKQNFENYLHYLIKLRINNDNFILKKTLIANESIYNIKLDELSKIINDLFLMKIKNILVAKPKLKDIDKIYSDLSIKKSDFDIKFFEMIKEIEEENNRNYIQSKNFENNDKNEKIKSEEPRNSIITDTRRSSKLATLINNTSNKNLGLIQQNQSTENLIDIEKNRNHDRRHTQNKGSISSNLSSGKVTQLSISKKLSDNKEEVNYGFMKKLSKFDNNLENQFKERSNNDIGFRIVEKCEDSFSDSQSSKSEKSIINNKHVNSNKIKNLNFSNNNQIPNNKKNKRISILSTNTAVSRLSILKRFNNDPGLSQAEFLKSNIRKNIEENKIEEDVESVVSKERLNEDEELEELKDEFIRLKNEINYSTEEKISILLNKRFGKMLVENTTKIDNLIHKHFDISKVNMEKEENMKKFDYFYRLSLDQGKYFGDFALEGACERSATIVTGEDSILGSLESEVYKNYVKAEKLKVKQKEISFLTDNFFYKNVSKFKFEKKYFSNFEQVDYFKNKILYSFDNDFLNLEKIHEVDQNSKLEDNSIYFLLEGEVELSVNMSLFEINNFLKLFETKLLNYKSMYLNEINDGIATYKAITKSDKIKETKNECGYIDEKNILSKGLNLIHKNLHEYNMSYKSIKNSKIKLSEAEKLALIEKRNIQNYFKLIKEDIDNSSEKKRIKIIEELKQKFHILVSKIEESNHIVFGCPEFFFSFKNFITTKIISPKAKFYKLPLHYLNKQISYEETILKSFRRMALTQFVWLYERFNQIKNLKINNVIANNKKTLSILEEIEYENDIIVPRNLISNQEYNIVVGPSHSIVLKTENNLNVKKNNKNIDSTTTEIFENTEIKYGRNKDDKDSPNKLKLNDLSFKFAYTSTDINDKKDVINNLKSLKSYKININDNLSKENNDDKMNFPISSMMKNNSIEINTESKYSNKNDSLRVSYNIKDSLTMKNLIDSNKCINITNTLSKSNASLIQIESNKEIKEDEKKFKLLPISTIEKMNYKDLKRKVKEKKLDIESKKKIKKDGVDVYLNRLITKMNKEIETNCFIHGIKVNNVNYIENMKKTDGIVHSKLFNFKNTTNSLENIVTTKDTHEIFDSDLYTTLTDEKGLAFTLPSIQGEELSLRKTHFSKNKEKNKNLMNESIYLPYTVRSKIDGIIKDKQYGYADSIYTNNKKYKSKYDKLFSIKKDINIGAYNNKTNINFIEALSKIRLSKKGRNNNNKSLEDCDAEYKFSISHRKIK